MVYEEEFPGYKVSKEIVRLVKEGVLEDTSWKPDASPSFGTKLKDCNWIRIWTEHPNVGQRKGSVYRYSAFVQEDLRYEPSETIVQTNDVYEAIMALRNVIERRGIHRARFRLLGFCRDPR